MRKLIYLIIGVLMLLVSIYSAMANDNLPIIVRPKVSGTIQTNTNFDYEFNFSTTITCDNIILSKTATVTTDAYGIGSINLDITNINSSAKFLCEYRSGALRRIHNISEGIFNKIKSSGNLEVQGNISVVNNNKIFMQIDNNYSAETLPISAQFSGFNLKDTITGNNYFEIGRGNISLLGDQMLNGLVFKSLTNDFGSIIALINNDSNDAVNINNFQGINLYTGLDINLHSSFGNQSASPPELVLEGSSGNITTSGSIDATDYYLDGVLQNFSSSFNGGVITNDLTIKKSDNATTFLLIQNTDESDDFNDANPQIQLISGEGGDSKGGQISFYRNRTGNGIPDFLVIQNTAPVTTGNSAGLLFGSMSGNIYFTQGAGGSIVQTGIDANGTWFLGDLTTSSHGLNIPISGNLIANSGEFNNILYADDGINVANGKFVFDDDSSYANLSNLRVQNFVDFFNGVFLFNNSNSLATLSNAKIINYFEVSFPNVFSVNVSTGITTIGNAIFQGATFNHLTADYIDAVGGISVQNNTNGTVFIDIENLNDGSAATSSFYLHNDLGEEFNLNLLSSGFLFEGTPYPSLSLMSTNSIGGLRIENTVADIMFNTYDSVDNILTLGKGNSTFIGSVIINSLSGSGNDYACLDLNGQLYRSDAGCT